MGRPLYLCQGKMASLVEHPKNLINHLSLTHSDLWVSRFHHVISFIGSCLTSRPTASRGSRPAVTCSRACTCRSPSSGRSCTTRSTFCWEPFTEESSKRPSNDSITCESSQQPLSNLFLSALTTTFCLPTLPWVTIKNSCLTLVKFSCYLDPGGWAASHWCPFTN